MRLPFFKKLGLNRRKSAAGWVVGQQAGFAGEKILVHGLPLPQKAALPGAPLMGTTLSRFIELGPYNEQSEMPSPLLEDIGGS